MRKLIPAILSGIVIAAGIVGTFMVAAMHETAAIEERKALIKELRAAKMQVTQLRYHQERADRYAGVIAWAANGGTFMVGSDILVDCKQVNFPDATEPGHLKSIDPNPDPDMGYVEVLP